MTPAEVRALSPAEYVGFRSAMIDYQKRVEKEARKAARGKRG